jgi:hypothetical protein
MLLMPIVPSDAVKRTATHLVADFETPPLVKVCVSGIDTPNTSTRSIFSVIRMFLVRCGSRGTGIDARG